MCERVGAAHSQSDAALRYNSSGIASSPAPRAREREMQRSRQMPRRLALPAAFFAGGVVSEGDDNLLVVASSMIEPSFS